MKGLLQRIDGACVRLDRDLAGGIRWPFIICAAAFVLKAIYIVQSADALYIRVPIMDARYYDAMAQDIARGHILRREAFFMGPLYPYVLAAVYAVFGRDFTLVRLIQAAGGALTVFLLFLLGRRLFRPSAALAAALMLTLYGAMTFYDGLMLMEWLGTLLNLAAIYVLVAGNDDASPRHAMLAGALLGLSVLARASVLIFVVFAALWIARSGARAGRRRRAAVFAGTVFVVMLPAMIHNFVSSRVFVPVTSNAGLNFFVGNGAQANGMFVPISDVDVIDDFTTREYVERMTGREMDPAELSRFWLAQALDDMEESPGRALRLFGTKTALFFNGYEVPQLESFDLEVRQRSMLRVLFIRLWPIMVLGVFGMFLAARNWRRHSLAFGYVLLYALSITLFFVTGRYRSQVTPVLCLFAGYALVALPGYARGLRSAAAVAVSLAVLALATSPSLFRIDEAMIQFRDQVRKGRRLGELGEYQAALGEVNQAIAIYPKASEGYVQRAIIHKQANDEFKAIEDYNRALRLDPAQPSVHYNLAQSLRRVNMLEEAVREYRGTLQYQPRMLQAHNNLGITLREMKRYDEAIDAFRKAIELSPGYEKAYNNLGASYAEMGRLDDAIQMFRETTERFPDYATGYKNLAMAHAARREPRPALEAMRRYVELAPGDLDARELVTKLEIAVRADTTGGR